VWDSVEFPARHQPGDLKGVLVAMHEPVERFGSLVDPAREPERPPATRLVEQELPGLERGRIAERQIGQGPDGVVARQAHDAGQNSAPDA